MTVFELLSHRSEYEELTLNMRVPGPNKAGTLSNLRWFLKEGVGRNTKFPGVERAKELAQMIIDHEDRRKRRK